MKTQDSIEQKNFFKKEFVTRLQAEPFSADGARSVGAAKIHNSTDYFFENYFVPPLSTIDPKTFIDTSYADEEIEEADAMAGGVNEDAKQTRKKEVDELNDFQTNVIGLKKSLLAIRGPAGSGKTTYLHSLKRILDNDTRFFVCDVTIKKTRIPFLKSAINFSDVDNNIIWRVVGHFSSYISELLSDIPADSEDAYSKANAILELHKNHKFERGDYVPDDRINSFFKTLEQSISPAIAETPAKFGTRLAEHLSKTFDEFKKLSLDKEGNVDIIESGKKALSYVVSLVTLIIIWLSQTTNKKYICAIDNIERLLLIKQKIIVSDEDIDTIIMEIISAEEVYREIYTAQKVPNCFTFILVTRDATFTFINHAHDHIKDNQLVRLDTKISYDDVIKQRVFNYKTKDEEYRKFIKACEGNKYVEMFKIVIFDKTIFKWCMSTVIKRMCNSNYRQVVIQLKNIIENIEYDEILFGSSG